MKLAHLFTLITCMLMVGSVAAQQIKFLQPLPHRTVDATVKPSFAKPHVSVNMETGTLQVYSRNDAAWSDVQTVGSNAYGEMYIADTCAMSFAATTALPIERLTGGLLQDFVMVSDSVLKYTGADTKVFRVSYSVSLSFSEANNILSGYVIIGSTAQTKSRFKVTATTINERYVVSGSALISLAQNETVRVMLVPSAHTGTDIITVRDGNINIVEVR